MSVDYDSGGGLGRLATFDQTSTLTRISGTGTIATSTDLPMAGQAQHVRLTQASTAETVWEFSIPTTSMIDGYMRLPIKVVGGGTQVTNLRWLDVYVAESKTALNAGNYKRFRIANYGTRWFGSFFVYAAAHVGDVTSVGTVDMTKITYVQFRVNLVSSSPTVQIDVAWMDWQPNASSKAKVVLWIDDGNDSAYTGFLPKLEPYGFPATLAATMNRVAGGGGGALTKSQADYLVSVGWQVGLHDYDGHASLEGETLRTNIQSSIDRHIALGFPADDRLDWAWWGGLNKTYANYLVVASEFRSGRYNTSTLDQPETLPPADRSLTRAWLVGDNDTLTQWTDFIEKTIPMRGLAQFVFHGNSSKVDLLAQWLDANRHRVDVVTMSEALAASTAPQPPDPTEPTETPVSTPIQSNIGKVLTNTTGSQVTATLALTQAPAAGNLLRGTLMVDKSAGTFSLPAGSGWTIEGTPYVGSSVSQVAVYRVAAGGGVAADMSVTINWTVAHAAGWVIAEYPLTGAVLANTATSPLTDTATTTTGPVDAGAATANGVAFADWSMDSLEASPTLFSSEPAFTGGYTVAVEARGVADSARPTEDNGGSIVVTATKDLANGATTATTATTTVSNRSDQTVLRVSRYTGSAGTTPPATVTCTGVEVGAVTGSSATLAMDLASSASARAVLSTSSTLATPLYGASGTGVVVKSTVSNLIPGTVYYWGVEVNGTLAAAPRGSFRTARQGAASFKVVLGSCGGQNSSPYISNAISNAPTYEAMRNVGADLLLEMGDRHYGDLGNVAQSVYVAKQAAVRATARRKALYGSLWTAYHTDDHDGPGNNWTSATAGVATAQAAFEQAIPHFPLGVSGTQAQTFVNGRVRFIVLDSRSKRVAGNMLGDAQRDWCLNLLATATERLIVVDTGVPWVADGTGSDGTDGWGSFTTSRAEIAAGITAARARGVGVILVAGDAHMIAMDDGTNSQYDPAAAGQPGPKVFQFAPFDSSASTKGGPYSEGVYNSSRYQFGVLDIVDDGTDVTVTGTGYSTSETSPYSPTARMSMTETVVGTGEPEPEPDPEPEPPASNVGWNVWDPVAQAWVPLSGGGSGGARSGFFRIPWDTAAGDWLHPTLASALAAGMVESDTAVFKGPIDVDPQPEPATWARPGDEWSRPQ